MTGLLDPLADLGVALHGDRAREERHLDLVLVEEAHEAPDAGAAPVLVDRLGAEVAVLGVHGVRDLGEALVAAVAGGLRVLGALLVVDDEVDGHLGLVRPHDLRLVPPVADEVRRGPGTS